MPEELSAEGRRRRAGARLRQPGGQRGEVQPAATARSAHPALVTATSWSSGCSDDGIGHPGRTRLDDLRHAPPYSGRPAPRIPGHRGSAWRSAHRIVTRLGGEIRVESTPGRARRSPCASPAEPSDRSASAVSAGRPGRPAARRSCRRGCPRVTRSSPVWNASTTRVIAATPTSSRWNGSGSRCAGGAVQVGDPTAEGVGDHRTDHAGDRGAQDRPEQAELARRARSPSPQPPHRRPRSGSSGRASSRGPSQGVTTCGAADVPRSAAAE